MDRWVEIEKEYIKGKLPYARGNVQKNYDLKRKAIVRNDLKPLYGLRLEDIYFLANLVEQKEISVKGSKAMKGDKVARLPSLQAAGNRERLMRVMKYELMNQEVEAAKPKKYIRHVLMHELGRLRQGEVHYSCGARELVGKGVRHDCGKKWMDDWNRNLNKTFDPKDCPDVVKAMWDSHIYATNQASIAVDIQSKFAGKYKCVVLDKLRLDLVDLLASEDVFQWR